MEIRAESTNPKAAKTPVEILELFLIVLSLGAALLFAFFDNSRSFWMDEAYTTLLAIGNFGGLMERLIINGLAPPLYFMLVWGWAKLFGISEAAMRFWPAVFYLLTLPAAYALGRTVSGGKKTGLLAAFLYLISPVAILHAQNARMYSLLGLLVTLSILFYLKLFWLKTGSKKDFWLYVTVNLVGAFTHYWFFFLLASQGIAYLCLFRDVSIKKFLAAQAFSILPFLVLWAPRLLAQMDTGATSWMTKPSVGALSSTLLGFYGGGKKGALVYAGFLALFLLNVQGAKLRLWNFSRLKEFILEKTSLALFIFISVSLLLPFLISQVSPMYVVGRYTIIALPPLAVLLASGLGRLANRWLLAGFCYFLLAAVTFGFVQSRMVHREWTDKSTAGYLAKNVAEEDLLVFTTLSGTVIQYYFMLWKLDKNLAPITFPVEIESHNVWIDVPRSLREKPRLEREADSLVEAIDSRLGGRNAKIWVLYGAFPEVGDIIKDRLDARFEVAEEKDLKESFYTFYNKILIYQKRAEKPPPLGDGAL